MSLLSKRIVAYAVRVPYWLWALCSGAIFSLLLVSPWGKGGETAYECNLRTIPQELATIWMTSYSAWVSTIQSMGVLARIVPFVVVASALGWLVAAILCSLRLLVDTKTLDSQFSRGPVGIRRRKSEFFAVACLMLLTLWLTTNLVSQNPWIASLSAMSAILGALVVYTLRLLLRRRRMTRGPRRLPLEK